MADPSGTLSRSGLIFGLIAYTWWGLVPLYFRQIKDVPPLEILAHRIVWSMGLLTGVMLLVGGWGELVRVLKSRKLVLTLLLSAVLLAANWLLYIYATVTGRVAESSLGYYMMPLVNAFLATIFLKEKLRPAHYPALAMVAIGVAVPMVTIGAGWIAILLPVLFGVYTLVRKLVAVESFAGLTVETLLLLPLSLGWLTWLGVNNELHFGRDANLDGLLVMSGVITVVPLLAFTLSIRRLPLLTISFIQFFSPTMQFLVALYWNGEVMEPAQWVAMGCVWVAVVIFISDAILQTYAKRNRASAERDLHRVPSTLTAAVRSR